MGGSIVGWASGGMQGRVRVDMQDGGLGVDGVEFRWDAWSGEGMVWVECFGLDAPNQNGTHGDKKRFGVLGWVG